MNNSTELSKNINEQFIAAMAELGINRSQLAKRLGITHANVDSFLSLKKGLTVRTIEKVAAAIGGRLEIRFIRNRTELELLREEVASLKAQLEAEK